MSAPSVIDLTSYEALSAATSWPIFSGLAINKGSVLVVASSVAGYQSFSTASPGWTMIGEAFSGITGFNQDVATAVFAKTGDADSDSFTLAMSDSQHASAILVRVGNAEEVSGTPSEASKDPPSHSIDKSRPARWITAFANPQQNATAAPSGYSGLTTVGSGAAKLAVAHRALSTKTENPGLFATLGAPNQSVVWTVASYNFKRRTSCSGFI
jgi:hypothetical protein